MGAWRDFLDKQSEAPILPGNATPASPTSKPSLVDALKSRPLRVLASILGAIIVISFLSAAAGGPGQQHLRSAIKLGNYWDASAESYNDALDNAPAGKFGIEPTWSKDPTNGFWYPPDIQPAHLNRYRRANATFVSLVRNNELNSIRDSMKQVETAFNRKAGYPWVFLNDEPFTERFKKGVRQMTRSEIHFGVIPKEHWSYPEWIDQEKAAKERQRMAADHVIYASSESYRHMCRFNSGFFYKHPIMQQFDYYWRVEPGVEFFCDIDYDPFLFMEANNKTYSFTIAIFEYQRTIESLWPTVQSFVKKHPDYLAPNNALNFLVDSNDIDGPYNLCHFWSNFEIADMRFWRSKVYEDFFQYLDATGNFFYERWGDAPVHSIAAALFLPRERLHFFDDIAYRHNPYTHCPTNQEKYHNNGKCNCDPKTSFDLDGYSCMRHAWRVVPSPNGESHIA